MRLLRVLVVALVVPLVAAGAVPVAAGPALAQDAGAGPFRGLGTWVDAFDYVPALLQTLGPPPVTPATVDDMAQLGVDTLYLQAAIDDARTGGRIAHRRLVGEMLEQAHDNGMEVVAWYYPAFADTARDLRFLEALHDFRSDGERFDGIAIDIESQFVPDLEERNANVVDLARRLRRAVGDDYPVGAIVFPAVQLEVVNPALWPRFPYTRLAQHVDVWMPMTYWTFRDGDYRDAYTYTEESVRRLRRNLDDRDATVHPIGGLAELSGARDYDRYMRAVRRTDSVGWSIYDLNSTFTSAWTRLQRP